MHCYGAFMTSHLKMAVNPVESTDLQPTTKHPPVWYLATN